MTSWAVFKKLPLTIYATFGAVGAKPSLMDGASEQNR
jgi:hypothetical protein